MGSNFEFETILKLPLKLLSDEGNSFGIQFSGIKSLNFFCFPLPFRHILWMDLLHGKTEVFLNAQYKKNREKWHINGIDRPIFPMYYFMKATESF